MIRLTPEFTLQLAPSGTKGGEHPAFAMSCKEFDEVFRSAIDCGIPYVDSCHAVGNMLWPGDESAARGMGKALYFFGPGKHPIEIGDSEIQAGWSIS